MRVQKFLSAAVIGSLTLLAGVAQAQQGRVAAEEAGCTRTRAEVRGECVTFMKTHRWDEAAGNWVQIGKGKPAAKLPEGVTPREKVRAERDTFMKNNKWNEGKGMWEPMGATPRDISTVSRKDMQKETAAFMRTHMWDEGTATYVPKKAK